MKTHFRLNQRAGGILLHPTSLPGLYGSGDLGPAAREFVDFLAAAGQRWWQMLPTGPPGPGNGPYSSCSAFAGSPLLISLDTLAEDGLLNPKELKPARNPRTERVCYGAVKRFRMARLRRAFERFVQQDGLQQQEFANFRTEQQSWLDDYTLFAVLKRTHRDREWLRWKMDLRLHRRSALRRIRSELKHELDFERYLQFEFQRQWSVLRRYAHKHGVGLIGDIPIFVAHDSADVWANRGLFDLDPRGRARTVSGVPPDCFSKTGQLWGHPQYRWRKHQATGFAWWLDRFTRMFDQFDAVRIDHFLGFHRCWVVSGRARTALHGRWVKTPGAELFQILRRSMGRLEIIAEDLGVVTPEATALRDRFGWPGLRLLHFAFGGDDDHYNRPHAYPRNCVVFPGTHDNDTTVGWFRKLRAEARKDRHKDELSPYDRVQHYTGNKGQEIHWDIIRLAYMSVANIAMIPAQDLLGLDNRARMNFPGTVTRNWEWRLRPGALNNRIAERLRQMTITYDRLRC